MTPQFRGVPAAPNRSEIEARVLLAEQSPEHDDQWLLSLEIVASKDVEGPNFARVGETVAAFAFDPPPGLAANVTIAAQAEFRGDERGGRFRLTELRVLNGD